MIKQARKVIVYSLAVILMSGIGVSVGAGCTAKCAAKCAAES